MLVITPRGIARSLGLLAIRKLSAADRAEPDGLNLYTIRGRSELADMIGPTQTRGLSFGQRTPRERLEDNGIERRVG
jgi:hypothetical protein